MIWLNAILPLALLIASIITLRYLYSFANKLAKILSKIWIPTEVVLFVLVGASLNLSYMAEMSAITITIIVIGVLFRSCGVHLCLIKTQLNFKERSFCALAFLPKATVQAAIGGTALAIGLEAGTLILLVSVLAILVTAPLGAFGIDFMRRRIFDREILNQNRED